TTVRRGRCIGGRGGSRRNVIIKIGCRGQGASLINEIGHDLDMTYVSDIIRHHCQAIEIAARGWSNHDAFDGAPRTERMLMPSGDRWALRGHKRIALISAASQIAGNARPNDGIQFLLIGELLDATLRQMLAGVSDVRRS